MQRIEACADLHFLDLVDGLSVGEHDAALFKLRSSVREIVLDDEILSLLGVYERSHIGLHGGDNGSKLVDAVSVDDLRNGLVGTRGDLVDHGPGEGDLVAFDISLKLRLCDAVRNPALCESSDSGFKLVAVVGAVVHADHGDRLLVCLKAGVEERRYFAHVALGLLGTLFHIGDDSGDHLALAVYEAVALLCDGKACHLQGILAEDLAKSRVSGFVIAVQLQGFHYAADYGLLDRAGGLKCYQNGEVIVGMIHLLDDLVVIAFRYGQSAVQNAVIEEVLHYVCLECPENIAAAEVDPERILFGRFSYCFSIILRKRVTFFFPPLPVL